jgi:hypothetical protein
MVENLTRNAMIIFFLAKLLEIQIEGESVNHIIVFMILSLLRNSLDDFDAVQNQNEQKK